MSDTVSDALASLREHVPSVPDAVTDAVSKVDPTAIRDAVGDSVKGKRSLLAIMLGAFAICGVIVALARRNNNAEPPPAF